MHELEQRIADWRAELASREGVDRQTARELESHLRDAVEAKLQEGATPDDAFDSARAELGATDQLQRELLMVHGDVSMRQKLLRLLVGIVTIATIHGFLGYIPQFLSRLLLVSGVRGVVQMPWTLRLAPNDPMALGWPDGTPIETDRIGTAALISQSVWHFALLALVVFAFVSMCSRRSLLSRFTAWCSDRGIRLTIALFLICGLNYLHRTYVFRNSAWMFLFGDESLQFPPDAYGMPDYEYSLGMIYFTHWPVTAWIIPTASALLCLFAFRAIRKDGASPIVWAVAGHFVWQSGVGFAWITYSLLSRLTYGTTLQAFWLSGGSILFEAVVILTAIGFLLRKLVTANVPLLPQLRRSRAAPFVVIGLWLIGTTGLITPFLIPSQANPIEYPQFSLFGQTMNMSSMPLIYFICMVALAFEWKRNRTASDPGFPTVS